MTSTWNNINHSTSSYDSDDKLKRYVKAILESPKTVAIEKIATTYWHHKPPLSQPDTEEVERFMVWAEKETVIKILKAGIPLPPQSECRYFVNREPFPLSSIVVIHTFESDGSNWELVSIEVKMMDPIDVISP